MAVVINSVTQSGGTLSHGQTWTITGSGFGTKSPAAPIVWDNCSGASPWDGAWPSVGTTYNTDYRTEQRSIPMPHARTTKYLCGAHGNSNGADDGYNVMFWKNRTISLPDTSFWSWRQRYDDAWTFGLGDPADDNLKMFDYSNGTEPYDLPNNWYTEWNARPTSNSSSCSYHWEDDNSSLEDPDQNGHNSFWDSAINPMSGVWTQIEHLLELTTETNGNIVVLENGVTKMNYLGITDLMAGTSRTLAIGGYARAQGNANNWRYFTDLYVDTTLARVQILNAAGTVREMQIPTAWSDTSITVTVNLGVLPDTGPAILGVVGTDGTSATLAISLGNAIKGSPLGGLG